MPKFNVGDRVKVAFNPATPDPDVKDQANGKHAGSGAYRTEAEYGTVVEVRDNDEYIVAVEQPPQTRKRLIPVSKLSPE